MKQAKKLLAKYHVDNPSGCRYRFIDCKTERQILHYHDYYEIFLTLSDGIIHSVNKKDIPLKEGSLVFIRPQDTHIFKFKSEECYMVNLTFNEKTAELLFEYLAEGFPSKLLIESELPPLVILNSKEKNKLSEKLSALNSIDWDDEIKLKSNMRLLLANIFMNYFAFYTETTDDKVPYWLSYTCEKMQKKENFSQGLKRMIEISGKTYEHIARSLKQHFGSTPTSYINEIRLNYAANMLLNSSYSITDIIYDSGFSNVSWFNTCFKKKYGISPKNFREKYK